MQKLVLKRGEERRLLAGHCWIYSNEVDTARSPLSSFNAGELVALYSSREQPLGVGYINPNTLLAFRLLSRHANEMIDVTFFKKRIAQALQLRDRYFSAPFYRLVFGESDGLPGLIIDRYDHYIVLQLTTAGMANLQAPLLTAIVELLQPTGILLKNDHAMCQQEGLTPEIKILFGDITENLVVEENETQFEFPSRTSQKTGWFYDHRINRQAIFPWIKEKRVLDLFSYLGGFGIEAATHGASHVTCVDSSSLAIKWIQHNARLNQVEDRITTIEADIFDWLASASTQFDVILLDPPALIKRKKDLKTGMAAYLKLNRLALRLLQPNGILVSSSCSMQLSRDLLLDTIHQASIKEKKPLTILSQLHQGPDHPIHPAIKETEYLKGFVAAIEE